MMTVQNSKSTVQEDGHIRVADWPLSPIQSRIWRLAETGNEAIYGRQMLGIAFPAVDGMAARRALEVLVERYPAIRRGFLVRPGGAVYQSLRSSRSVDMLEQELKDVEDVREALWLSAVAENARQIDLEQDNPARFVLFKVDGKVVGALFSLHPVIGDCTALDLLASDFIRQVHGGGLLPIQAAMPALETDSWMRAGRPFHEIAKEHVDFWFGRLSRQESIASLLPIGSSDAKAGDAVWREHIVEIEPDGYPGSNGPVAEISDHVLAALTISLRRYSGCGTQRLGLVTRGELAEAATRVEDILVLTSQIDGTMTLEGVKDLMAREIGVSASRFLPFETLADVLLRRDESFDTTSLAKTILDVRRERDVENAASGGVAIDVVVEPPARRDAELVVTVDRIREGSLRIRFGFDSEKQDEAHVARFARDMATVLRRLRISPAEKVREIPFVSSKELARLSAPYPDQPWNDDGNPVHEVISAQAKRRPEAFAVAQGERVLSHGELETAANRLANHLLGTCVGAETRVAIAIDKSIEAMVAILAVLKAGAAFTPVEPDHPEARNRHILTAPGVSLVITRTRFLDSLPQDISIPILDLDKIDLSSQSTEPPTTSIAPDQLAYVIYTSGSTGAPKGVAVEHGPLAHHCKATMRIYEMSEESREYPVLPFTSDGGHERWMVPLMAGGGVVLTPDRLVTPEETFALMKRHGVNNASLPTSYVRGLAEYGGEHGDIPRLRLYSFGGEALPRAVFEMISDNLKADLLINGYGPTETIMTPMIWKISAGTRFDGAVAPIGRGVGDRRIYILDEDLVPVPVGVVGEIHIGGSGLARGYQGRPDLTEERFIPDPFSTTGGRLYKSGDLGRWRDDGIVEFAGRVDHQVKLRGYRIEPGEIEAVLRADSRVAEVVVLLHQDGPRASLVAYVVARQGEKLNVNELRRSALVALPDYMVPQSIMILDALPMGPNSKLDRHALPKPRIDKESIAPENEKERAILEVWREMLGIPDIGVTENFFEIGGQSLAAVRIVSRLRARYPEWPLTIADMFNHQTVRDLAAAIEGTRNETGVNVVYLRRGGDRPVLYCFPGLLVSTREYMRLVDYLGPDQPATGFICYSLAETKTLSTRVEDITARYAEEIRRLAKGQPCAFLGWSWGGLLAYEAARQIGADIDLRMIGMVDVCDMDEEFTVGVRPRFAGGVREETHRRVQKWLAATPMRDDWERLFAAMDDEVYAQFLSHVVKHNVTLPSDGPDIGSEEHTFWVLIDNAMIFRNYKLPESDFRIHAFAAEDSLTRSLNVIDWRRYSPNATAPELVNGTNHLTIIGKSPFHQRFSRRLDAAFAAGPSTAK